jgi:ferric-chelate reductase
MGILIWIIFSGSRFTRNWKYEFFVINHIFSVLLFLTFYFIHTNNYLNSWRYVWAATYLWIAAIFIRWCQSSLASKYFVRMKASVEVTLDSSMNEEKQGSVIRIAVNTPIKWKP